MMAKVNPLQSGWIGISSTSSKFIRIFGLVPVSIFFQASCTAPVKKVEHSWAVLDTSRDLECSPWPVVEEMAIVSEVVFHPSAAGEIMAAGTGLDRSGKAAMFVSPISKGSSTEAVMTSYKGAPPRLFRGSCPFQEPATGPVSRLEWGVPEKGSCFVLGSDAGDKLEWKVSWGKVISTNAIDSGMLNVKITSPMESATALPAKEGVFLAAVTGDSLIGDANLEVFFFRLGRPDPVWSKVIKLPHTHLGEPVLVADGAMGHAVLMVPKWVDLESTLGTYRLSPEGLVASANQGIFPAASVVVDTVEITGGAAVMIRSRTKDKWRYKLCEMKW